jgi:LCP family protein required for cell wall assembly
MRRLRRVRAGLLAAAVAIAVVAASAVGSLWLSLAGIERDPGLMPQRTAGSSAGALNLLVIGSDSHDLTGRASVLMVAHVDAERRNVHLISLPCELLVTGADGGTDRLSHLFDRGGAAPVVVAVERQLGITIDHVAVTWLAGMSRLIDLLGGIPVDNPVAATTGRFAFPRGQITLSGEEALDFVRSDAAGLGADVLDRAESQRLVLQGLITRLLTSTALMNPGVVKGVLDQLATDVIVDSGLDARRMAELFFALRTRSGAQHLGAIKLPTGERGVLPSGETYVRADPDRAPALGRAIASDTLESWERNR